MSTHRMNGLTTLDLVLEIQKGTPGAIQVAQDRIARGVKPKNEVLLTFALDAAKAKRPTSGRQRNAVRNEAIRKAQNARTARRSRTKSKSAPTVTPTRREHPDKGKVKLGNEEDAAIRDFVYNTLGLRGEAYQTEVKRRGGITSKTERLEMTREAFFEVNADIWPNAKVAKTTTSA